MRLIDVCHLGRDRVIGAWFVDGVIVDPGPTSCLDTLLEGLGDERPRALALTHIHLDHAGAAGSLVQRWPDLDVWVSERGARHLSEPDRLLKSARRLYGDDMDRLWGDMVPVPPDRIRTLSSDPSVEERVGPFRVAATPGHASHHVTYLHEDTGVAFTGDAAGVRIGDAAAFAPTPPPDIDLEAWRASLDRIEAWKPASLAPTHFGRHDDVERHLGQLRAWLDEWPPRVRELDADEWVRAWSGHVHAELDERTAASVLQAAPPDQLYLGLERYWSQREDSGTTAS